MIRGLEVLEPARAASVEAWLATSVGDCGSCGNPVLIVHPRRTEKDGSFAHISCDSIAATLTDAEPVSAAVEARGRRSDWG
jgi:hypothetical protein